VDRGDRLKSTSSPSRKTSGRPTFRSASERPLDPIPRHTAERALGQDLSAVRIHADVQPGDDRISAGADALTVGRDVYFRPGAYSPNTIAGRLLLAHELVHVGQQRVGTSTDAAAHGSGSRTSEIEADRLAAHVAAGDGAFGPPRASLPVGTVSTYKSFEHAQAGTIGTYIGPQEIPYVVKKGEMPPAIAARFGVPLAALLERNRDKLHTWTTPTGHRIRGFNAGATIVVPTGDLAPRTPKTGEAPTAAPIGVTAGGVAMDYGTAMAMADYYLTPEAMIGAPTAEMTVLRDLVTAEGKAPASVTEADWERATAGRPPTPAGTPRTYMDLNMANVEHFAPAKGASLQLKPGIDNRDSWHFYHNQALDTARAGDVNRALAINAFADHFLTDAFAAGHLFNKQAVMTAVAGRLTTAAQRETFANAIATTVMADVHANTVCRRFEGKKYGGWWQINDANRLSAVLQGIADQRPNVLPNAIAGSIHDALNTAGVDVTNSTKPPTSWTVKGDGSMEPTGLDVMRRAVALSYSQVVNIGGKVGAYDYATMDAAVWAYTPTPTTSGQASIDAQIARLVDPTSAAAIAGVATMVIANIEFLMDSAATVAPDRVRRAPAP
jgi:Domain of unknown function (DUF4157)